MSETGIALVPFPALHAELECNPPQSHIFPPGWWPLLRVVGTRSALIGLAGQPDWPVAWAGVTTAYIHVKDGPRTVASRQSATVSRGGNSCFTICLPKWNNELTMPLHLSRTELCYYLCSFRIEVAEARQWAREQALHFLNIPLHLPMGRIDKKARGHLSQKEHCSVDKSQYIRTSMLFFKNMTQICQEREVWK